MSLANILNTEHLPNGKIRITFDSADGHRTYEYSGSSARAVKKGKDPATVIGGKLVEHKKAK